MEDTRFVLIGVLARPHGIKGEVCVDWYADSPSVLQGRFFLQAGKEPPRLAKAVDVREHQGRFLLRLEGIHDRNAAERLRGMKILVLKDDLPELGADEAYLHKLIGLTVVLDAENTVLGTLDHVEFPAGKEVWAIMTPDGKEVLFPAVEDFINGFDLEHGEVYISPPEGLLEIYLEDSSDSDECDIDSVK